MLKLNVSVRSRTLVAAFVLLFMAAACVPPRIGVSWPAVDVVTVFGSDRIFVAYNDYVALVDPENGTTTKLLDAEGNVRQDADGKARVWKLEGRDYENAQFYARPLMLDEDRMLLPSYSQRLFEVDIITARIENPTAIATSGHLVSDIASSDDLLFLPLQESGVAALNRESYDEEWKAATKEGVWAAPLSLNGVVYATSLDHHLYALDAENGEERWKVDLGGGIMSTPVSDGERLFVGSLAKKLFSISLDGEILNEFETQNWIWGSPAVRDGVVYAADLSGFVYALDADTLNVVWSTQAAGRGIAHMPLVTEKFVIIASRDGVVHWLDIKDGVEVFNREVEGRPEILTNLLLLEPGETLDLLEPLVVVSTTNLSHLLVAYTLENGRESWVYARE